MKGTRVLIYGLAFACLAGRADAQASDANRSSTVVRAECLRGDAEVLRMPQMQLYLHDFQTQGDAMAVSIPSRNWGERNILDRTTFKLSYGDKYTLRPGDGFEIDTDSDGTSWSMTYELPLSVFGRNDELVAQKRKEKNDRAAARAEASRKFMNLLFDYKVAVGKYNDDPEKAAGLYAVERLAMEIADHSPRFEGNCLIQAM